MFSYGFVFVRCEVRVSRRMREWFVSKLGGGGLNLEGVHDGVCSPHDPSLQPITDSLPLTAWKLDTQNCIHGQLPLAL